MSPAISSPNPSSPGPRSTGRRADPLRVSARLTLLTLLGLLGPAQTHAQAQPAATNTGSIANTAPAVDKTPRKVTVAGTEVFAVGFDLLTSFPYQIIDAGTGATPADIAAAEKNDQVPAYIRNYHEQKVLLTGFMMPLQIENGLTKKFILMRDVNTCCYGATPNMNDYVIVTMTGPGVKIIQDVPIELLGKFRVEQKYEAGYVVSLFVLEGEKFLGVKS